MRRIPESVGVRSALGLLVLVFIVSGCSGRKHSTADPFDSFRAEIDAQVSEASRATEMQAAVEKMEQAMNELLELTFAQQEAMAGWLENYESSREEFDQLIADYLEGRQPIVDRMLQAHLEIKNKATAEEWKHLAKKGREVAAQVARHNLKSTTDD